MQKKPRPSFLALLFGIAVMIAVGAGWLLAKRSVDLMQTRTAGMDVEVPAMQKRQVHLYFGDSNGRYLSAEQRVVDDPADAASLARGLVEALIQGPSRAATRTLPKESGLRGVFITPEGIAYLDFKANAFDHHPGGVETEMLTIYSIVNTLVLNMEEIRWVKFLIGGQEAATLAGHVDLSRPFKADMLWVR